MRNVEVPGEEVTGIRILLIESSAKDAQTISDAIKRQLPSNQDFDLRCCTTLLDGLRDIENSRSPFDCILLDLNLTDAQGLEALLRVKSLTRSTPLLVITHLDDQQTIRSAIQLGAHKVIQKSSELARIDLWAQIADAIMNMHTSSTHAVPIPARKCYFHLDASLCITRWDSDCELITGWPASKILHKPIEALTVKGFRPDVHAALLQPNAHKERSIEFDLITPQRRVMRLSLEACESVDHLSRWEFSIPKDEQASTLAAQVVTAIMRNSRDLLFILDYDGRIRRCNEAAIHRLGIPEAAIIGTNLVQLVTVSAQPLASQALKNLLHGEHYSSDQFEFGSQPPQPHQITCSADFSPLRDSFGGLIGGCLLATPRND